MVEKQAKSSLLRGMKSLVLGKTKGVPQTKTRGDFESFANLPTEIRLKIWHYQDPRVIELVPDGSGHWKTSTPPPTVLSVCRESREEAQRFYYRLRLADSINCHCRNNYTYIDFESDSIYISKGNPKTQDLTLVAKLLWNQEQLQEHLVHLSLHHHLWQKLKSYDRVGILIKLVSLKDLGIVHEADVRKRGDRGKTAKERLAQYKTIDGCSSCDLSADEISRMKENNWMPKVYSCGEPDIPAPPRATQQLMTNNAVSFNF